jgi:hypothetical protein
MGFDHDRAILVISMLWEYTSRLPLPLQPSRPSVLPDVDPLESHRISRSSIIELICLPNFTTGEDRRIEDTRQNASISVHLLNANRGFGWGR